MHNIAVPENKTIIITGAAGNLGQAVVKKFADNNYSIAATIRHTQPKADNYPENKYKKFVVDLNDEQAVQNFVDEVIKQYGKIDAAVLTTGGFVMGKMADTKTSDIEQQYRLNFETAYNAAKPIFMQMLHQNSGRIFLIGSKPGLIAKEAKGKIAYALSKSLIFYLAEILNDEAKGKNVAVNVVVPGTIDTPQNREAMPDADFSKWTTAEAIADIIYWHCTKEAAVLRNSIIKAYNYA